MKNGRSVVMVVDADSDAREMVADMLRDNHYEVVLENSGRSALDYLQQDPYQIDLVLCAYNLPEINGIEFLELLKLSQRMREVPVIIVIDAMQYAPQMESNIMEHGAEDILLRPFDKRIWENRINNTVNAHRHLLCINIMEEVVEKQLDQCTESLGLCKCRVCRTDVLSLALNRLRPRYVSSEKGRLLAIIDQMSYDYVPELIKAITEGAQIVKNNPKHPPIQ